MRKLLIAISIILLALSGFIQYRAMSIPAYVMYYQDNREAAAPQSNSVKTEEIIEQNDKELEAKQNLVDELKATIADLENKVLSKNKEAQEFVKEKTSEKSPKVLAVFSGKTFSSGQIVVSEQLKITVEELIADIQASPAYRLIIEGHTDNIPIRITTENRFVDNMELSFLRAKSVANILINKGIPADRISVIGYGDTRPKADNETKEGRAINRRVEVKLIPNDRSSDL